MAIPIDTQFVRELIRQTWDSVDELAIGWDERRKSGIQKTGAPRDRATIYRWLRHGLPNRRDEILGFCATLDIDPLAIINIDSDSFVRLFERERLLFVLNSVRASRLSALWSLLRPAQHWPDQRISHDFYARDWTISEFAHPARDVVNVFAGIRLSEADPAANDGGNRVYYFAYRKAGATDGLWRPYGVVRRRGEVATCIAEMGYCQQMRLEQDAPVNVETFFGPGPADFRIACLHPFHTETNAPSDCGAALRFPA